MGQFFGWVLAGQHNIQQHAQRINIGSLIGLGVAGILMPATSAMLHNLSTVAISLRSMTNLMPAGDAEKPVK